MIQILHLLSGTLVCIIEGGHLYKYSFRGQVDTARDVYEARYQTGLPLYETSQTTSPYVVRLWQWDDAESSYAIEILNSPGHQVFSSYDEALVCYNTLSEFFPDEIASDIKMELVNVHQGVIYELKSTTLHPPVHSWQW